MQEFATVPLLHVDALEFTLKPCSKGKECLHEKKSCESIQAKSIKICIKINNDFHFLFQRDQLYSVGGETCVLSW